MGVEIKGRRAPWSLEDSLDELGQLVRTAGGQVVAVVTQRLDRPSNAYVGSGKLEELKALHSQALFDTAVFDDELRPSQQRNLERGLGAKVIDRTALILDVFAKHARTSEGILQVELAQHEYLLPRLVGQWSHLERLGGGIGTRGPGESQLETDRRIIQRRIQKLKEELESVRNQRSIHRRRRQQAGAPVISLVGYTNAGKSSLMRALSGATVTVEDKLFSTLDPLTRQIDLPNGATALLTDTVGFIHKLPPALLAAFRATLEELEEAELMLHVVDISHRNAAEQAQVVEGVLRELGLAEKPRLLALNKADLLMPNEDGRREPELANLLAAPQRTVLVSALKGWGLERLRLALHELLEEVDTGLKLPRRAAPEA